MNAVVCVDAHSRCMCALLLVQAGHKTACAVKREEREHPLLHSKRRTQVQECVRGSSDPVAALLADHDESIECAMELITALRSGDAVIIEIPQRIGKRSGPTFSVMKKGLVYTRSVLHYTAVQHHHHHHSCLVCC
jgi:hypothetical protein